MTEPVCFIPDWRGKHLIIRGEGKCLKQDSPQKTMKSIYIYMMYTKNTLELGLYETRNET